MLQSECWREWPDRAERPKRRSRRNGTSRGTRTQANERADASSAPPASLRVLPSPPPTSTTAATAVVWGAALAWVSACAWLSKSPERRQLLLGACVASMASGATSSAATTASSSCSSSTATTRLTRGALKKITHSTTTSTTCDGNEQVLLEQYAAFQHGLPTPKHKRRRLDSTASDVTAEEPGHDAVADQENHAPAVNVESKAMAVMDGSPAKAVSDHDVPNVDGALVEKTPEATSVTPTPAVAELELAQDEKKLDGAPEGELFIVTVLASSEISPSSDVEAEVAAIEEVLVAKAVVGAESSGVKDENELNWAKEYAAIDSIRRLAIHHHARLASLLDETQGRVVTDLVCTAAMNLRSAMVRNALLCIQDVVVVTKQHGERFYGDIVPVLLQRTANEKQFIRDLARDALMKCVETNPGETLLTEFLRISTTEKNAQIVSTAGLYTQKCIGRMDKAKLKAFVLTAHDSFLGEMSAFLNCKVVECKAATRRTLQFLRKHIGDAKFTALVKSKLEGTAQFELLKASEEKKAASAKSGLPKLSMRERMMQMKKQQEANGNAAGVATDEVVVLVPDATR